MDRGGQRIDRADHLAGIDRRLTGHGVVGLGRDVVAAVFGKAHVDRAVAEAARVGLAVAFEPRPLIGQAAMRAAGQAAVKQTVDQAFGRGLRGDFIACRAERGAGVEGKDQQPAAIDLIGEIDLCPVGCPFGRDLGPPRHRRGQQRAQHEPRQPSRPWRRFHDIRLHFPILA